MNLPDFMVISPPKTGTTWLFNNLVKHPRIFIPENKEVKYFSRHWNICDVEWYSSMYQRGYGKLKGDITPDYAVIPEDRIPIIKDLMPALKIILIIRNPIDRSWSHIKHQFKHKESTFYITCCDFVEFRKARLIEALTSNIVVTYSDYEMILRRWLKYFSPRNIYVGFFDDLCNNPEKLFKEVLQHIGAPINIDWSIFPLKTKFFQGIPYNMPTDIKAFLTEFYASKIASLSTFLKRTFGISLPSSWHRCCKQSKFFSLPHEFINAFFEGIDDSSFLKELLKREAILSSGTGLIKKSYQGYVIFAFRGL